MSAIRTFAAVALLAATPAVAQTDECDCKPNRACVPCPPAKKPKPRVDPAEQEEPAGPPVALPDRPEASSRRRQQSALLFAVKTGLFQPTSRLGGALYVGAELAYVPPGFRQALAAVLELDWVRPQTGGALGDPRLVGGGSYEMSDQQVGVLLSAMYRAQDLFVPGLTPYAGLGPGLYFHRASVTAFGSTNVETATKLGFQLAAGSDYRLGPGAVFAEVRYHFARVDFRTTGDANVGGFMAMGLGYRLKMF